MGKYIIVILCSILFISACSNDQPAPKFDGKGEGVPALSGTPSEAPLMSGVNSASRGGVEVLKNPTPILQTNESEAVYVVPGKNQSPAEFEPVLDSIELKYIPAKKAAELLSRLLPDTCAVEGERGNSLILKAKPADIYKIKRFIRSIDKPSPQIMIESRVVEISESGLKDLGVNWGNTPGSYKLSLDLSNGNVNADAVSMTLNTLIEKGEAKVISSPKVSALDNCEASVNIGSRIPYAVPVTSSSSTTQWTVQYIDAGVSLKITPRLGADDMITVSICPEVSSISEWRTTAAGEFPVISTRNAQSCVRVKDGDTIVIGGLIDDSDRENISKIPVAGDIPLISALFGNSTKEKTRTEVIFMITPSVMR